MNAKIQADHRVTQLCMGSVAHTVYNWSNCELVATQCTIGRARGHTSLSLLGLTKPVSLVTVAWS